MDYLAVHFVCMSKFCRLKKGTSSRRGRNTNAVIIMCCIPMSMAMANDVNECNGALETPSSDTVRAFSHYHFTVSSQVYANSKPMN